MKTATLCRKKPMKTTKLKQLRKLADEFVDSTLGADMEIFQFDRIKTKDEFALGYRHGIGAYFYLEEKDVREENLDGSITSTPSIFIRAQLCWIDDGKWEDDLNNLGMFLAPETAIHAATAKIYADELANYFGLI
jgi:hypothetical protein